MSHMVMTPTHYGCASGGERACDRAGMVITCCDAQRIAHPVYISVQISVTFLDLIEVESERVGRLHDQYSRECRNAKLELASIRKRIDEKLVALKNSYLRERQELPAPEVPASR